MPKLEDLAQSNPKQRRDAGVNSSRFIDRTGTRNGKWTYLHPDYNHSAGPSVPVKWIRQCDCGNCIESAIYKSRGGSCGCSRKGPISALWKGGKYQTKNGYVHVWVSGYHPRVKGSTGYVLEHILAMEKKLGRYVTRTETVHHINGQRDDNRIENLELWDQSHPPGQRHGDKMKFYMGELLKKCDRKMLSEFCNSVLK